MDTRADAQAEARIAELEGKLSVAMGAVDFWQTVSSQQADQIRQLIEGRDALAARVRVLQAAMRNQPQEDPS